MKTKYLQVKSNNPFNSQAKMLFHLDKLKEYKETGDTTPILMEVNLSNSCPLNCIWCISAYSHREEFIDTKHLLKFLKEYKEAGGKAVNFSGGGEPTTHPDFIKIIKETKKIGLNQGLMTCGVYPSEYNLAIEECCDWVRYSVDTVDKARYEKLKGVDALNMVKRNLVMINKDKINVGINANLPQENGCINELNSLIEYNKSLNKTYLQIRPVLPKYGLQRVEKNIMKFQIEFLKLIDREANITISWDKFYDLLKDNNGQEYTKCRGHIFEPVLDANGDLCVCMYFLKDKRFVFGNIYKNTFNEIWHGDKRKKVKEMCDKIDLSKCQVCCKDNEINKFLAFLDNGIEDVNFI